MGRVKPSFPGPHVLAVLLVLVGCYWSRYPQLMETHLTLLDEFAAKLDDVARGERGVRLEVLPEFVYPLERAQDFSRIAARRFPDRASLRAFRVVLQRYGALVDDPAYLLQPDAVVQIEKRRVALAEAIEVTRADLAREQASE